MKNTYLFFALALLFSFSAYSQTKLELKPDQSMVITGKGPGQDATINPYADQHSLALVENLGQNPFSIRVQYQGKIVETIAIKPGETKHVELLKGRELYLDATLKSEAKVDFRVLAY